MSSSRDNPLARFSAFIWGIGIFLLFVVGLGVLYWIDHKEPVDLEAGAAQVRYETKESVFAAEQANLAYKEVEPGKKVQVPPHDVFDLVGKQLSSTKAAAVEKPEQWYPGTPGHPHPLPQDPTAAAIDLVAIEKLTPSADAPVDPAVMEAGKAQYLICSACHGQSGEGTAVAPIHAGSDWVTGPVTNLIRIQLRGLQGPLKVKGNLFNGPAPMPPAAYQTDEQIAAVLTYVRKSFGNNSSAVLPEQVKACRSEVGKPPLTEADLLKPTN